MIILRQFTNLKFETNFQRRKNIITAVQQNRYYLYSRISNFFFFLFSGVEMIYTRFPSLNPRDLRFGLKNDFFLSGVLAPQTKKNITNNNSCHRSRAPISSGPIITIRGKSLLPAGTAFARFLLFCEYSKDDYYYYFHPRRGRRPL